MSVADSPSLSPEFPGVYYAQLIGFELPSPRLWLVPLESIFGWAKRQVLGDCEFATLDKLQAAVERCFRRRAKEARERRHQAWIKALKATA